eukprot:9903595-Karenia_brevis.AAC.1
MHQPDHGAQERVGQVDLAALTPTCGTEGFTRWATKDGHDRAASNKRGPKGNIILPGPHDHH